MLTAYTGNSAYCFSNCLHMCLTHAGMSHVPDVSLLECMTGTPFGASFLQLQTPLFFPSPSGKASPDRGLTRALDTIGWSCEALRFEDSDTASTALREVLHRGPALLGPLDMGWLPYDPMHSYKRGADHFVVALRLVGELVQVHDPQSYPFAVLPTADLMRAWNAKGIAYAVASYTFRCDFREHRFVSENERLRATLELAREMAADPPTGPVAFGGALAFTRAAEVLRDGPPDAFTGLLTHFALPLGARRCVDGARFFDSMGKPEAARLMVAKGEAFGQAQYYAAQNDWTRTAEIFDYLSSIEAQIALAI